VLIGATVDLNYALYAGFAAIIVIFGALTFRMGGVLCCMFKTKLTMKERVFCRLWDNIGSLRKRLNYQGYNV
jgi:hypothetical protein